MGRRNTIQREMVYNAVNSLKNHATADEIYAFIKKDHPSIGKGTVYRNLNILVQDGDVLKVEVPDGPHRYDHTKRAHCHIMCVQCRNIYDLDTKDLPDLGQYVNDSHGIKFLGYDILFKGICPDCQEKK